MGGNRNDPLGASRAAKIMGSIALDRGSDARWELADVIAYNTATHTARVQTHRGRPLFDVPQVKDSPTAYEALRPGTTVVISYDLGFPAIVGFLDLPAAERINRPVRITGMPELGDENPLTETHGMQTFKASDAPDDLMTGDWAKVGSLGNHIAVLEGGVTSLGSPTALLRTHGVQGALQVIAKTMQTMTDFGEWHVENDQGRVSFILNAGASQTTQTGAGEGHWTIRLEAGAKGDLFRLRITEPDDHTLFSFHVGPDGRCQIYGEGGVDISGGAEADDAQQNIANNRSVTVEGNDKLEVGGNQDVLVDQALTETIGSDHTLAVGQCEVQHVAVDQTVSVGGKRTEVIAGGDPLQATPGNLAVETRLLNGGWMIDIGDPAKGANISAMAAYKVKTALGNIEMDSGGGMKLHALQNVDLTSTALVTVNGAAHPLPKFDVYLRDTAQIWALLMTVLQAGTVGSPTAQQLIALAAAQARFQEYIGKLMTGLPYESIKARNG